MLDQNLRVCWILNKMNKMNSWTLLKRLHERTKEWSALEGGLLWCLLWKIRVCRVPVVTVLELIWVRSNDQGRIVTNTGCLCQLNKVV